MTAHLVRTAGVPSRSVFLEQLSTTAWNPFIFKFGFTIPMNPRLGRYLLLHGPFRQLKEHNLIEFMSATCSLTNIPICSCVPHNEIGLPPVGQIGDINMFDFLTLPYLCVRTVNIHDSGESKHTDRLTTTEDGRDNTTVSQLLETHNTIR